METVRYTYKLRYQQSWPEHYDLCPECGQPDNCGDCNHQPLTPTEVAWLGGTFKPVDLTD